MWTIIKFANNKLCDAQGMLPQPRASLAFLEHQTLQQQLASPALRPPTLPHAEIAAATEREGVSATSVPLGPELATVRLPFRTGLREVFEGATPELGASLPRVHRQASTLPGIAEGAMEIGRAATLPPLAGSQMHRQRSLHPAPRFEQVRGIPNSAACMCHCSRAVCMVLTGFRHAA